MLPGLLPSVLCILSALTLASCRREQSPSRRFIGSIGHAIDHAVHEVGHGIDHVVHEVKCHVAGCGGGGTDPVVHNPPSISCPTVPTVTAPPRATSVKVTWSEHAGASRSGPAPGSILPEGVTSVTYTVKDSSTGLSNSCTVKIVVRVVRCSLPAAAPDNGAMMCRGTHGRMVYGDTCRYECSRGYEMAGAGSSKCALNGRWSSSAPTCKPVPCGSPTPITNGHFSCNGNTFRSACHVTCDEGYTADTTARSVTCQADRRWTHTRGCLDLKPPLINHCPASKVYVADRGSTSTTVRWVRVTGVDPPTALTPLVVQTEGPPPGSVVGEGRHHVEYKVVDAAGNVAVHPCSFNVTVQAVRCSAPRLDNKLLLQYACPNDRIHGSECLLSCHHGNLAGPRKIVCEKDNFFPPSAQWRWNTTTGVQPHCQVRSCPALRSPRGGALSCDGWDTGALCQMQCKDGFTFPSAAQSGIFVCGHDNKTWFPPDVPDCLATSTFYSISMASNFYYRGQCDQTHLQLVRRNFILALKASMFGLEMCKDVLACQADNVRVTCGSRLTKRDIKPVIRVKVKFTFPYKLLGNDTTARGLMKFKDTFVKGIKGSAKLLTIGSKHLLLDSHLTSFEELSPRCRRGQKTVNDTCSGCGPGYVLNRVTETCVACPVGYFQDRDSAPWCQPCPLRHTTSTSAATSFTECATRCPPGEFSDTGLSPCSLCPLGTFQPDHSSTSCRRCPPGTITPLDGAVTIQDCQAYDVTIAGHGKALFRQHARDLNQWTYSMWFRLHDSIQGDVMLGQWSTNAAQQVVALSITNGTVNFYSQGNVYSKTGITLMPTWNHCVLTASEGAAAHVYVNGHDVLTVKTSMLSIPQNSRLHIVADAAGVSVSRVILRDYVIRDALIPGLARSCSVDETPRELDLDSIDYDESNTDVIFPSVCHERSQ
ncbi:sushi, von Willebrand factor type A, EGF and pentraxin domain-containing protein 1-like [Haliotis rufescens]|uniref:sushi, von Willebrand factor type A, EGF and pentraxin domain-containing protein 1-like n=1 Tax=Haliotis rufescens TaxID=6454 RepID=UPI00201F31A8|nr:sushi, von Willebrand factor type A, EGF and pentraxin domain-containing protein 1-like [Haliotis rufescens]